jgi:hypothetical protein
MGRASTVCPLLVTFHTRNICDRVEWACRQWANLHANVGGARAFGCAGILCLSVETQKQNDSDAIRSSKRDAHRWNRRLAPHIGSTNHLVSFDSMRLDGKRGPERLFIKKIDFGAIRIRCDGFATLRG